MSSPDSPAWVDRRSALRRIGAGVVLAGGLVGAGLWMRESSRPAALVQVTWNELALGLVPLELAEVRRLGRLFASIAFPESGPTVISRSLPGLASGVWDDDGLRWRGQPWVIPSELVSHVRDQFAAGLVVVVEAWVLSRIEASLCALAALHHAGSKSAETSPARAAHWPARSDVP